MAISIIQTPQVLMPVYNTIAFTVDSTNKTQCNFNYICDVYHGATFIKRLKLFPSGANGYATFKVERVLEDLLSYDLKPNLYGASLFSLNPKSILRYNLKFGEEFDPSAQCTAGTIIYPNQIASDSINNFQAFNGALQKKEWLGWNYLQHGGTNDLSIFLTRTPPKVLIQYGSQMVWNVFYSAGFTRVVALMVARTYNSNGVFIAEYHYANAVANVLPIDILSVGVGPENLNNSTLAFGAQPVITSFVSYYTVQLYNAAVQAITQPVRIDIDLRNVKWTPHRLWWLNRLGAFDSYTFTLKDKRNVQINRNEFKKIYGTYSVDGAGGGVWNYNMQERGRTTLSVNAQEGRMYQSNLLTELEALWMEELFTSPEVYEVTENGILCYGSAYFINREDCPVDNPNCYLSPMPSFLPINFIAELNPLVIKSTTWEEKVKNKIRNINYTIDIDVAEAVNIQRN